MSASSKAGSKRSRTSGKSKDVTEKKARADEDIPDTSDSSKEEDEPSHTNSSGKLAFKFFDRPCVELAKALLGTKFVRTTESGIRLEGAIVETEAYLGGEDKAAHSHNGKRTDRNEAMYMKPGTIYVYNIYGMYSCINISSQGVRQLAKDFSP